MNSKATRARFCALLTELEPSSHGRCIVPMRNGRLPISVVPAIIRRAELGDELEGDAGAVLRVADGIGAVVPRALHRAHAERVAADLGRASNNKARRAWR